MDTAKRKPVIAWWLLVLSSFWLLSGVSGGDERRTARNAVVSTQRVTSSSVSLTWRTTFGVRETRVYVCPEPLAPSSSTALPCVLVGRASARTPSYTIKKLAAGTDVFIRLEFDDISGEVQTTSVHARTLGGPGVPLDGPVRSVHAYAPRILSLVIANPSTRFDVRSGAAEGNLGAAWQSGIWNVRRHDGRTVDVVSVHRHSVPVGQPAYNVGYGQPANDNIVDVEHRIFLVLAESIGSSGMFTVTHAGAAGTSLEMVLPYSDRYLETPVIQVNQVGYNPRASRRWAYVSGWLGDGGPLDLSSLPERAEVLTDSADPMRPRETALHDLRIAPRARTDPDAGTEVREIDLAKLAAVEGARYRVRVPGVGVSWATAVSEEAAFKAFYTVARGLFHNRWCGKLEARYTDWNRPEDHCRVYLAEGRSYREGFFARESAITRPRPLRGGHHDAGDFDVRPFHVLVAQYLFRAFEMAREHFTDGQLTIPESGNAVPDILDEALWSVAAWQQLQNADGSVRAGAESWRHPFGIHFAHDDQLPYWTFDPTPWHSAYCAALFAQAAHLVTPFDRKRALELEGAARKAYGWASRSGAPRAYLLYAAGELFRLTREEVFAADYQRYWKALDKWGGGPFDVLQYAARIYPGTFEDPKQQNPMADYTIAYAVGHPPDAIVATTVAKLTGVANVRADAVNYSPRAHRNGRTGNAAIDWGGLTSTGRHVDGIYQRLQLGGLSGEQRQNYFDALSLSADYVLGCNPASYVFITGLGSRNPREPLHLDSLSFVRMKGMPPIPGLPVYGPVASLPGAHYYRAPGAAFYPPFVSQPPALRFADTRASVVTSEFSVWETQAPLAALFGALIGKGMEPDPIAGPRHSPRTSGAP